MDKRPIWAPQPSLNTTRDAEKRSAFANLRCISSLSIPASCITPPTTPHPTPWEGKSNTSTPKWEPCCERAQHRMDALPGRGYYLIWNVASQALPFSLNTSQVQVLQGQKCFLTPIARSSQPQEQHSAGLLDTFYEAVVSLSSAWEHSDFWRTAKR